MQTIERNSPTEAELSPLVVRPEEGLVMEIGGERAVVKLSSDQTNGMLAMADVTVEPGSGPPPHVHTREDEVFFVLEGQMRFLVGERAIEATPGTVVFAPRGTPHTFRGSGDGPARMIVMITPSANMESFFKEYTPLLMAESIDFPQMMAVAERHGLQFLPSLEPIIA